ncbi:hypothetical protein MJD09_08395 [bacterium]|nr:hypothetical protein [bacterium]
MSTGWIHAAATFLSKYLTVYFVGFVSLFVLHKKLFSQEKLYTSNVARSDSTEQNWNDETVYSIEMLRLERWLQENPETVSDAMLMKEIVALKQEAEELSKGGDFATAVIWLETVWGLLLPETPAAFGEPRDESLDFLEGLGQGLLEERSSYFTWSRELTSGVDLWRQQFRFAFVQDDSTFVESSGNPFTGVRLNFNYRSNDRRSIQGYTDFRYSRDYLTGEADVKFTNPIGRFSRWHLGNRFEANSFYGEFQLKYLQNVSELGVSLRDLGPVSLDLKDEFLLRRYEGESLINPNYFDNAFRSQVLLDYGIGSTVGVGYRNTLRSYSTYSQYDYNEHLLDASLYQNAPQSVSLSLEGELRWRDYSTATTEEILQDYHEKYARGDIKLPITNSFGLELQGAIAYRDYDFVNASSLPDYRSWDVEPEVYINIGSNWQLSAGFFYADEKYDDPSARLAQALDADISIPFENNVTFGPVLSIEFFQIDGITFSARESFQLQRYPEAETDNLLRSNPYSDRNINSLLIYFTWDLPAGWRFTMLANIDHDRSRRDDSSDFQNTIVGFEINYSF